MKFSFWLCITILFISLCAGCGAAPQQEKPHKNKKNDDEAISAALGKLDAADRKLAEAQKFCAVQTKKRLGSMDTPVKIILKGEPVFLCCDGCVDEAKKDPAKTLATVKELVKANK